MFTLRTSDYKKRRGDKLTPPLCSSCTQKHITSKYEQEIADYIYTFYNGECIRNIRSKLNRKELDLYYPEKKIAIEFNGDYWHNEDHKSKDYHYNKFIECFNKGILLVSIFEFHWINNRENISNYIKDLFNNVSNKLSFNKQNYMNNNYPCHNCSFDSSTLIEDFYEYDKSKVYTCGYSPLINNRD